MCAYIFVPRISFGSFPAQEVTSREYNEHVIEGDTSSLRGRPRKVPLQFEDAVGIAGNSARIALRELYDSNPHALYCIVWHLMALHRMVVPTPFLLLIIIITTIIIIIIMLSILTIIIISIRCADES